MRGVLTTVGLLFTAVHQGFPGAPESAGERKGMNCLGGILRLKSVAVGGSMSRHEKLLAKLSNKHSVFTWGELTALLSGFGYRQINGNGSRVKFDNGNPLAMINLHKPHPGNELKAYIRCQVIEHLKAGGLI
jgi:hypothetical protein